MTGDRSGGKRTQARPRGYLAERRKAVGLDQETLALRLGVHKATVMRWERGPAEPQPWLRPKLAAALGISYDTLADLLAGPHSAAGPCCSDWKTCGLPSSATWTPTGAGRSVSISPTYEVRLRWRR